MIGWNTEHMIHWKQTGEFAFDLECSCGWKPEETCVSMDRGNQLANEHWNVAIPKPKPPIWRTKDGKEIPISELTDIHLGNILRMLKRRGIARRQENLDAMMDIAGSIFAPRGEMATYMFDQEFDHYLNAEWEEMYAPTFIEPLLDEADKRDLEWETL